MGRLDVKDGAATLSGWTCRCEDSSQEKIVWGKKINNVEQYCFWEQMDQEFPTMKWLQTWADRTGLNLASKQTEEGLAMLKMQLETLFRAEGPLSREWFDSEKFAAASTGVFKTLSNLRPKASASTSGMIRAALSGLFSKYLEPAPKR